MADPYTLGNYPGFEAVMAFNPPLAGLSGLLPLTNAKHLTTKEGGTPSAAAALAPANGGGLAVSDFSVMYHSGRLYVSLWREYAGHQLVSIFYSSSTNIALASTTLLLSELTGADPKEDGQDELGNSWTMFTPKVEWTFTGLTLESCHETMGPRATGSIDCTFKYTGGGKTPLKAGGGNSGTPLVFSAAMIHAQ